MNFKKFFKNSISLLTLVAMLAVVMTGCGSNGTQGDKDNKSAADKKFINIATGGTAGVYYPLGGAIAEILNKNIAGANVTAQTTGASVANTNMLKDGSVQIAFIQNDIAYYADKGIEMFKDKKINNLKALATLYPETIQLVTLEKSGIKTVADLKGKKVAVGAAGSGVEANARQVMEAKGVTYKDITVRYLSFAEAASSLKDGNIDAAFVTAGFPTAAIQDVAAQHKIFIVPFDDTICDGLVKKYPFYTKTIIPANTYPGQDQEVKALSVKAMLVVTDQMDEQTGYDITKAIYSNLDKLKAAHSVGKLITKETAKEGLSIPIQAGADKFFKE